MDDLSLTTQVSCAGDAHVAATPGSGPSSDPPYLARSPGAAIHATRLWTARVLPDPAICRAKATGFAGYAKCEVEIPFECPHAQSFGFGFFCRHPERDEIARRTSARDR